MLLYCFVEGWNLLLINGGKFLPDQTSLNSFGHYFERVSEFLARTHSKRKTLTTDIMS